MCRRMDLCTSMSEGLGIGMDEIMGTGLGMGLDMDCG